MVPLLLDFIGERDGHLHGALLVGRMLLYLHAMDHVHTGAVVVVALKDQICFFFFGKCFNSGSFAHMSVLAQVAPWGTFQKKRCRSPGLVCRGVWVPIHPLGDAGWMDAPLMTVMGTRKIGPLQVNLVFTCIFYYAPIRTGDIVALDFGIVGTGRERRRINTDIEAAATMDDHHVLRANDPLCCGGQRCTQLECNTVRVVQGDLAVDVAKHGCDLFYFYFYLFQFHTPTKKK